MCNTTEIRYVGNNFGWLRVLVDTILLSLIIAITQQPLHIGVIPLLITTSIQALLIANMNRLLMYGIDRNELLEYFGRIEALQFFRIMSVIAKDLYENLK